MSGGLSDSYLEEASLEAGKVIIRCDVSMSPHTTMISCKIETIRLSGTVAKVILSSSTSTLSDTVIVSSRRPQSV